MFISGVGGDEVCVIIGGYGIGRDFGLEGFVLVGVGGFYLGNGFFDCVGYGDDFVGGVVKFDGEVLGNVDYVVVGNFVWGFVGGGGGSVGDILFYW